MRSRPRTTRLLVVSADANELAVVDRATRRVVQTLGEADGIGRDPRHVVVAPDGTRAWVSAFVGDRITALSRRGDRWAVAGTLAVGRRPSGLSITPDGKTLYVAHFLPRGLIADNEAWVSVVDTATLAEVRQAIWRDDGDPSEMTCLLGRFGLTPDRAAELSFEAVPGALAGVFLTPAGDHGYVPATELAPIPIFEGDPSKAQIGAVLGANNPAFLLPLDAHDRAAAGPLANPGGVDYIDDTTGFARCKRPRLELEFGTRLPMKDDPTELYAPGVATPSFATPLSETGVIRFVGYSRGGRRALALSHAADELVVFDATTHAPTTQRYLPLSGSNPTGIVVSPDGTRGYVSYDNTLAVSVIDLSAYAQPGALPDPSYVPFRFANVPGALPATAATQAFPVDSIADVPALPSANELGTIALVDADPMDPVLRRGRTLFDSSNPDKYPQLSAIREATCNACHPDGTADGSVWSTMEGERRTVSLAGGVAGRGWLHQSATHRNALEFSKIIVKERLGGTGLSDEDADALARFIAFGIPRSQSPVVDASLASAGQAVFAQHCTSCHQGAALTSGSPDPSDAYGGGGANEPMLLDVGDATDSAGAILGPAYTAMFPPVGAKLFAELRGDRALGDGDPVQQLLGFRARPNRARGQLKAPSLVGVWDRVLFFHDGHQSDLDAAVREIESARRRRRQRRRARRRSSSTSRPSRRHHDASARVHRFGRDCRRRRLRRLVAGAVARRHRRRRRRRGRRRPAARRRSGDARRRRRRQHDLHRVGVGVRPHRVHRRQDGHARRRRLPDDDARPSRQVRDRRQPRLPAVVRAHRPRRRRSLAAVDPLRRPRAGHAAAGRSAVDGHQGHRPRRHAGDARSAAAVTAASGGVVRAMHPKVACAD